MWIEELKSGKYQFYERYTDYLTGKKRRVSVTLDKNNAQTRKLALQILNEKISNINNDDYGNDVDLTFEQLVNRYRNYQIDKVKKSTYRRNVQASNSLMKILGKDVKVSKLNKLYIESRFNATGESNSTLNNRLVRFKAIIRWGYKCELVKDISFLDKLDPYKVTPAEEEEKKYLESHELKKLLGGMTIERWRLVTEFMALSGLRIGEVIALDNSSVDIKNKEIHVKQTYDPNNFVINTPKNGTMRIAYMQPELKKLCKYIKVYMLKQKLRYGYEKNDYFFSGEDGDRIHYYAFNKYLKEKSTEVLGKGITTHILRHTHGSLLLEQGIPVEVISRRLGHKDINVTKRIYLHVTEILRQKDNEQLAKIKIM